MSARRKSTPQKTSRKTATQLVPFDAARYLKSDQTIAAYLNEALRHEDPQFLLAALSDVARARGMSGVARSAGLGRENLYKALTPRANPRIKTIFRVAAALGVRFEVRVA
jgi:probable addiction module antidote protein